LETNVFHTSIAGSLPKPAWLSQTQQRWPQWKASGAELQQAKTDASLPWITLGRAWQFVPKNSVSAS